MDREIKQRWINALRSGEYEQGFGQLNDGERYCCLGVLCDIAVKDGVVRSSPVGALGKFIGYYVPTSDSGPWIDQDVLPEAVRDWAGLVEKNPRVTIGEDDTVISEVNDVYQLNFNQIAEIIEEQL